MGTHIIDWVCLLLRWTHVITAIAWIGASFYFVWLDNNLQPPAEPDTKSRGVDGELWAVHGGGFYNPQKYVLAPKALPKNLHWFYWESYTTWMTGFALFVTLYLTNASVYLIDPSIRVMSPSVAVGMALAYLVMGWVAYDSLCRLFGSNGKLLGAFVALYVALATYCACHVFSGRAAFLLTGAMMATMMSANVLVWIIPGQKRVVAALRSGNVPNPMDGKRGKQRSVHNTYFTLPVLLAMLSNHYNFLYGHKHNWLVLLTLMAAGVAVRQFFLLRHKGEIRYAYPAAGAALVAAVIVATAPVSVASTGDGPSAETSNPHGAEGRPSAKDLVTMHEVREVLAQRCFQCHSTNPTLMSSPPKQLKFDADTTIQANAPLIYQHVVQQKSMPLGNLTKMTEDERTLIAMWFEGQSHP
jgi:uncharacterized membrane protein